MAGPLLKAGARGGVAAFGRLGRGLVVPAGGRAGRPAGVAPGYPLLSYQASNSSRDTFSCRSIRPRKSRLIEKGCRARNEKGCPSRRTPAMRLATR